jgi:hypothetical protein
VEKVKEKEESFGRGVWVGFTFGKNGPGVNSRGLGIGSDTFDQSAFTTIF